MNDSVLSPREYEFKIKRFLIVSFLFYLIYAFFSDGFYHPDEYFQIIEFVNYKVGNISAQELPWEFETKIRPWFQVLFYYISYKVIFYIIPGIDFDLSMRFFHVQASILAFFAKIFFLFSIFKLGLFQDCDSEKKDFIIKWSLIFLFFWLFPYLSARTSSENFSSSFILLSFGWFFNSVQNKKEFSFDILSQKINISYFNIFILGILFGIVFQFRYQCIFIIIGCSLWIFLNIKNKSSFVFFLVSGFLIVLFIGILVDKWGYGNYQLTFYEYFLQNIIYDKASDFGISPWYGYIPKILKLEPIFGLFFILFYIALIFKYPKNFFLWSSILFIIIHVLIGHKEIRFLFPVFVFIWFPIIQILYDLKNSNYFKNKAITKYVFTLFLISNSITLACYALNPPNSSFFLRQKILFKKTVYITQQEYLNLSWKMKKIILVNSFSDFEKKIQKDPIYFYYTLKGTDNILPDFFKEKCHFVFLGQIVPTSILSYSSSYSLYTSVINKINSYTSLRDLFKNATINMIFECSNDKITPIISYNEKN